MDIDGGLRKRRRECVFINDELEDMKITKEYLRSYVRKINNNPVLFE